MKNLLTAVLLLFIVNHLAAQQVPQVSQRMSDVASFNPAAYGAMNNNQIKLLHRSQWVGFEGAPKTQLLTFNTTPDAKNGIGLFAMNDVAGAIHRFSVGAGYSYSVGFSGFTLAFGTSGKLTQYYIDLSEENPEHQDDSYLQMQELKINWVPDVSFGMMAYNRNFFAGLSATQMVESRVHKENKTGAEVFGLYHITSGYNWKINTSILLQPAVLLTFSREEPFQTEINLKALIKKKFLTGIAYRSNDAAVVMIGMDINEKIFAAYSYDIVTSKIRTQNSGTHEIVLTFRLKNKTAYSSVNLLY